MSTSYKLAKLLILGAPASGKGTISGRILDHFRLQHISSGDRLRQHMQDNTEIGKEAKKYISQGNLVPDAIITKFIVNELQQHKDKPYLLDGFPRTLSQAEDLHKHEKMDLIINLNVPFDVIIDRVKNRWLHLPSGRVYNIDFNAPKVAGKDDVTGEALIQRDDDKPEAVANRLKDYEIKTKPVVEFFRNNGTIVVDFTGRTTNEIWPKILDCLKEKL